MKRFIRLLTAALFVTLCIRPEASQSREIPVPPPESSIPAPVAYAIPPVEKLGNGRYKIGEVLVNKPDKSVSFPAQVNMDNGMLEYLIVYKSGKTHESLLRTGITPYNLQIAFALLGYEGTDKRLAGQGSPDTPRGEAVRITLESAGAEKGKEFPVEEWLTNRFGETLKSVAPLNWVYCGSYINSFGRFMSQETGSIVAIWHDPVAMIDNASPGGENNRIWYVNKGTVPAVGTPVTVTIKPAQ